MTAQTDAAATLLDDPEVVAINQGINHEYKLMLTELSRLTDEQLSARMRAYDSHQRFTLGRANTELMPIKELISKLKYGELLRDIPPVHSFFAKPVTQKNFPFLHAAMVKTLSILTEGVPENEVAMLSLYCHRVVVQPGNTYHGFFHRDNKKREKCGTMVYYPNVSFKEFSGCDFVCFDNKEPLPDREIIEQGPDYFFPKERYAGKAVIMQYPYNLIHGVTVGKNTLIDNSPRSQNVRDFLTDHPYNFVKDLVVITLSEACNAED